MSPYGTFQTQSLLRRHILAMLPAIALPALAPRQAFADSLPGDEPLTVTAADSIYYYKSLLNAVYADANRVGWQGQIKASQSCLAILDRLRETLQKLYDKLAAMPHRADWPLIDDHFNAIQENLVLVQASSTGQIHAHLVNLLPVTTASLASLLYEVSEKCDPDPHGEIRALLQNIFKVLDEQNQGLQQLTKQKNEAQEQFDKTAKWYRECADYMDRASQEVAIAAENQKAAHNIEDAKQYLKLAKQELQNFTVGETSGALSSKDTLMQLLDAIIKTLSGSPSQVRTSLNLSDPGTSSVSGAQLDPSNSSLIGYVRKAVRKGFTPGITLQVINCIAVCWPVWVLYVAANEAATRKDLIYSALSRGLCWGAKPSLYDSTADDLQKAYVVSSGLQKT